MTPKQAQIHKCQHLNDNKNYLDVVFDAERRMARGEKQVFCKSCQRWKWPDKLCGYAEVD